MGRSGVDDAKQRESGPDPRSIIPLSDPATMQPSFCATPGQPPAATLQVVINSVLSIAGSCMGAAAVARVLFGKLEMEIMLNATLAGGVAIGTSSDLVVSAWVAMLVGFLGGAFSAVCFQKLGPFLAQKINLQDTCGVNSLHGLPGIMGVLVSTVVIATSSGSGFPDDYFPVVADGGSLGGQVPQPWPTYVGLPCQCVFCHVCQRPPCTTTQLQVLAAGNWWPSVP